MWEGCPFPKVPGCYLLFSTGLIQKKKEKKVAQPVWLLQQAGEKAAASAYLRVLQLGHSSK